MVNWNLLLVKFGRNTAAEKFEKLALYYVQDVYKQYDWIPTKQSHDGNKDAHLGIGEEYDIWEEAKYKSGTNKIRRQDIDPTILSGLIQGNVRLVIFVTNALFPETLLARALLGAKIKGIEVTCVSGKQLEGWLYRHPNIYKKIFEEPLPPKSNNELIAEIVNATIFDIYSSEFNPFDIRKELILGEYYIISLTIYSSRRKCAQIVIDESAPVSIVENNNFNSAQSTIINEGINVISFLAKATKPFCGVIKIKIIIDSIVYYIVTNEIIIQRNFKYDLVYSQQLETIDKIKNTIDNQTSFSKHFIITL